MTDEIYNDIDENDENEENEELDETEMIAVEDVMLHSDTVNTLVIAAVVIFFGCVFIALTNYQDFSEKKPLTVKSFLSGQYLSEVEKRFNSSLPLQDYIHNANVFISSLFGLDSGGDYIDIEGKRAADDPYSIDQINLYTPITDSYSGDENDNEPDVPAVTDEKDGAETTDDGKNKKLSGITMTVTQSADDDNSSPDGTTITTNNNPPGATTTTTVPPVTSGTTDDTEPSDTEPSNTEPSDTELSETEPPDTEPVTSDEPEVPETDE